MINFKIILFVAFLSIFIITADSDAELVNAEQNNTSISNVSISHQLTEIRYSQEYSTLIGIVLAIIGIITSSGAFIFAYKGDVEIKKLLGKLGYTTHPKTLQYIMIDAK